MELGLGSSLLGMWRWRKKDIWETELTGLGDQMDVESNRVMSQGQSMGFWFDVAAVLETGNTEGGVAGPWLRG